MSKHVERAAQAACDLTSHGMTLAALDFGPSINPFDRIGAEPDLGHGTRGPSRATWASTSCRTGW